ncbi:hypothetical protein [Aliifodinibius salipaludis]|nr:hypothetical protein [Aliifodinibius salipaludis]
MSWLYIKVLFRNKRAVFQPINIVIFFYIGLFQFVVGAENNLLIQEVLGYSLAIISTGLFFTLHSYRLVSINFDALSVWPISYSSINLSVWLISFYISTLIFLSGFLVLVFLNKSLIFDLLSCYLFTIGVSNVAYLALAIQEEKRYDPSLSAFSTKGSRVSHPFINNAVTLCLGLFVFLVKMLSNWFGGYLFWFLMSSAGVVGLLLNPILLKKVDEFVLQRSYLMKEGFRK